MKLLLRTKILKSLSLLCYVAFLATVLLTTKSYGEKSSITNLSTIQLTLCSVLSLSIPIALFIKKKTI